MIIADFISIKNGRPCLQPTKTYVYDAPENVKMDIDRYNRAVNRFNENIRALTCLEQNGTLDKISMWHHTQTVTEYDGSTVTYVDFVFDTDAIDYRTTYMIKSLYPEQYITDLSPDKTMPCAYTHCMAVTGNMASTRKSVNDVRKRHELPIVQMLTDDAAKQIRRIRKENGPAASAVAAFNMVYGAAH